jgi:hypothetical protein
MNEVSFYSIDKLVEFGMGVSVANQMVNSMNQTIKNLVIPGAGNTTNSTNNADLYYAVIDNKAAGPYSYTELGRLISEKRIVKETYIWKPGMRQWNLAENVPEVLQLVALTPPPVPTGIE